LKKKTNNRVAIDLEALKVVNENVKSNIQTINDVGDTLSSF
jgi:hypothetical protein